jgi:hypothetical protein
MFGRKSKDAVPVVDEPALEELVLDDPVLDSWAPEASDLDPSAPQDRLRRRYARTTRHRVVPVVAGARGRIGPAVGEARGRVVPAVAGVRGTLLDTVAPAVAGAVTTAVTAAREGSLPTRAEARGRSALALAALRGELPQARHQRRWPVALLCLLAGASAGAAAGLLARRATGPSEPTYIPATSPPRSSGPAATDEPVEAGSDLGWPEQLDESRTGGGFGEPAAVMDDAMGPASAFLPVDEVDLTLAEDSSETHKPTH